MRRARVWQIVTVAALGMTSALAVTAQEEAGSDQAMAEMMAAWGRYAAVGPQHEALQRREGSWSATVKFWMAPGTEPEVSTATSTVEPIMGGRYMLERFSSSMPDGSAFEGMGLVGYDNIKQAFQALWIDTMSTGLLLAESTRASEDFSKIEYTGESPDPIAGAYKHQRSMEHWVDDDTRVLETWEAGPDGREMKTMEITYTRR